MLLLVAGLLLILQGHSYEVWMADQGGATGTLVRIYSEIDIARNINKPIEYDVNALQPDVQEKTGAAFARLHGILASPDNTLVTLNFVSSGYLVIQSTRGDRPLLCTFRTTRTTTGQQNHMSFWTPDGNYILVSNQNGRIMEKIRVEKSHGRITGLVFEANASLDLVGGDRILAQPIAIDANLGDQVSCRVEGTVANNQPTTTPLGNPKEAAGVRPRNAVICAIPVASANGPSRFVFATLGGGGLFVVDYTASPMQIVAEYDVNTIPAAGCGGQQQGNYFYTNTGTSGPGISQFCGARLCSGGEPAGHNGIVSRPAQRTECREFRASGRPWLGCGPRPFWKLGAAPV